MKQESEIRRIARYRCKYYLGWDKQHCGAGVDLHALIDMTRPGSAYRVPCLGDKHLVKYGEEKATCERYTLLTEEEIEKEVQDAYCIEHEVQHIANIKWRMKQMYDTPTQGTVSQFFTCPRCKASSLDVAMTVSGKIAGRCQTENCLNFIE